MKELTVDKCVLVHCDSSAEDAQQYRSNSLGFLCHWDTDTSLVACVNGGITRDYDSFSEIGKTWWTSVTLQNRYRNIARAISQPRRVDFMKRMKVPLHHADFDYVDAASQSNSLVWLSNEARWQINKFRKRIQTAFNVEIQNVNEYMSSVPAQGTAEAS